MCLLLIYHRVHEDWPLIVAANRHERLYRPAAPPRIHRNGVSFVAPVDLIAGGTWLGANDRGIVAAITNGRDRGKVDPSRPSRGLLCWRALETRSLEEAIAASLRSTRSTAYNPFQLALADRERAVVIANDGELSSTWLTAGLHVLTHRHGLDRWMPKRVVAAGDMAGAPLEEVEQRLGDVCRSHEPSGSPPFAPCVHDPAHGTRSSALVFVGAGPSASVRFAFTDGPPCQTGPYQEIELDINDGSAE
jgi:uncharacterized protein with NRDE domain